MATRISQICEGGGITYSAPTLEVLNLQVERGFAASDGYADEGYAGKDLFENVYGEDGYEY